MPRPTNQLESVPNVLFFTLFRWGQQWQRFSYNSCLWLVCWAACSWHPSTRTKTAASALTTPRFVGRKFARDYRPRSVAPSHVSTQCREIDKHFQSYSNVSTVWVANRSWSIHTMRLYFSSALLPKLPAQGIPNKWTRFLESEDLLLYQTAGKVMGIGLYPDNCHCRVTLSQRTAWLGW